MSPTSVKGGANGKEPTLTVYLNGPAPACGMKIHVSTSNPGIAWVGGTGYFTIPGGQSSITLSGFLGTRNVFFNRHVNIQVNVNGQVSHAVLQVRR